ncbi:MAG TPA: hypothetical protein VHO91_24025, partial [Rhodopila sp.]|nr:hypothetical protein [Rhodopila sp.]
MPLSGQAANAQDLSCRERESERRGIGTVFQELTLLPWMSVAENLLIGREPRFPFGLIRRGALAGEAEA